MDPELVLMVLALAWCTPLLLATSGVLGRLRREHAGMNQESACWWRIWAPVVPAAAAFTLLLGWALQEPEASDEVLHPVVLLWILPGLVIWARALVRAIRALWVRPVEVPAMTVGLLRPRVVIHPGLAEALSPAALRAVREHEEAHARARDPLRIWLAQLATDLQWPFPAAARRLHAWRDALELARDEDARRRGVDGTDLATALIVAARWSAGLPWGPVAAAVGAGSVLRLRISRLLAPLPVSSSPDTVGWRALAVAGVLLGCAVAGVLWGDVLITDLPGILR